jgi:hypothetical protein
MTHLVVFHLKSPAVANFTGSHSVRPSCQFGLAMLKHCGTSGVDHVSQRMTVQNGPHPGKPVETLLEMLSVCLVQAHRVWTGRCSA